jgi:ribonuclease Z
MRSTFYHRLVNGPFGDPALYVRLAHRGQALLFDCGDLRSLTTRELLKIRAVFISHAHIDHLIGFDTLLRQCLCRSQGLMLMGPEGILARLGSRLAGYTWNLTAGYPLTLTVREWTGTQVREQVFRACQGFQPEAERRWDCPDGVLFQTPYCQVQGVALQHGDIPSLAFVLQEPVHIAIRKEELLRRGYLPGPWLTRFKDLLLAPPPADVRIAVPLQSGAMAWVGLHDLRAQVASMERGMKIAYVTDVSPTQANYRRIVRLARDAHLLAIEATFAHRDLERARLRNHLTAHLAGRLGRLAGVARLQVFHHSPRYQHCPELLAEEARSAFRMGD